jgi:hypothetical protein
MNQATLGPQLGASGDVTWTTIKGNASDIARKLKDSYYEFYMGGITLHAGIGFQFQILFNKKWKKIGTKGGPGIGLDAGLFVGVMGHKN